MVIRIRLDKYLGDLNMGSRSQIKQYIRKGLVSVNGCVVDRPEYHLQESEDKVLVQGRELVYCKYGYYMMHKPSGVITAVRDREQTTVMDILPEWVKEKTRDLFPVGRLDKDTEGLLLFTNDGDLAHRLLSPDRHVLKVYYVETARCLKEEEAELLEHGVDIGERKNGRPGITRPASVKLLEGHAMYLTITEGKFHQVKRMLHAVGHEVMYLKRMSIGPIELDPHLAKGDVRELRKEEIDVLLQQ